MLLSPKSPFLYIGTSGWNYKTWKDTFYAGIKQKEWLEHYAQHFNAVEVNATFYRLLKENVISAWKRRTPENFYFAVKGSRYTTHTKRLTDPYQSIEKQKQNLDPLDYKLSVILWQMPASLEKDMSRLHEFCKALQSWKNKRHAIEFRNTSWFDEEVASLLQEFKLAVCISDAADWPMWDKVSTDLVYIRLHGHIHTYHSSYSEEKLSYWTSRIKNWLEEGLNIHVYFDNTDAGAAPNNALRLKELLQ